MPWLNLVYIAPTEFRKINCGILQDSIGLAIGLRYARSSRVIQLNNMENTESEHLDSKKDIV